MQVRESKKYRVFYENTYQLQGIVSWVNIKKVQYKFVKIFSSFWPKKQYPELVKVHIKYSVYSFNFTRLLFEML